MTDQIPPATSHYTERGNAHVDFLGGRKLVLAPVYVKRFAMPPRIEGLAGAALYGSSRRLEALASEKPFATFDPVTDRGFWSAGPVTQQELAKYWEVVDAIAVGINDGLRSGSIPKNRRHAEQDFVRIVCEGAWTRRELAEGLLPALEYRKAIDIFMDFDRLEMIVRKPGWFAEVRS